MPCWLGPAVSGSVPVVERGELTFMVGGGGAAPERVGPILDVLGEQVFRSASRARVPW